MRTHVQRSPPRAIAFSSMKTSRAGPFGSSTSGAKSARQPAGVTCRRRRSMAMREKIRNSDATVRASAGAGRYVVTLAPPRPVFRLRLRPRRPGFNSSVEDEMVITAYGSESLTSLERELISLPGKGGPRSARLTREHLFGSAAPGHSAAMVRTVPQSATMKFERKAFEFHEMPLSRWCVFEPSTEVETHVSPGSTSAAVGLAGRLAGWNCSPQRTVHRSPLESRRTNPSALGFHPAADTHRPVTPPARPKVAVRPAGTPETRRRASGQGTPPR